MGDMKNWNPPVVEVWNALDRGENMKKNVTNSPVHHYSLFILISKRWWTTFETSLGT